MIPSIQNLYSDSPAASTEAIEELVSGDGFYLEHIISRGDSSAPEDWFDQDHAEWVVLIRGKARLEFEEGDLDLGAGDAILIPAHLRHRVAETSLDATWIALHFQSD